MGIFIIPNIYIQIKDKVRNAIKWGVRVESFTYWFHTPGCKFHFQDNLYSKKLNTRIPIYSFVFTEILLFKSYQQYQQIWAI